MKFMERLTNRNESQTQNKYAYMKNPIDKTPKGEIKEELNQERF